MINITKVTKIPKNLKNTSAAFIRRNISSRNTQLNQTGSAGAKEAAVKITKSFAVPAGIGTGAAVGIAAAGSGLNSAMQSVGSGGKKAAFGLLMLAGLAVVAVYAVPKIMKAVK
jgi:hypothetical protein